MSSGFIKNLQSTEYQTGRQNGDIHGASIVSTQKITEGKYEAENQITLLLGFEATAHDAFSAEIKPQSLQYQWQYALTDHMGNLRVLFADKNGDGLIRQDTNSVLNEVLSIRNYSPFGLELGGSHKNRDLQNPYRFGGKEHSNFTGYSDFGGRWYDSNRSGWNQVDPLAEHPNQVSRSTYSAFWSNPITYNDPDGRCPSCPQGEQASQFYAKGANVTNQYGSWNWTGNAWQEAPRIGEYKPDMADRWREGNLLQQSAYSLVDGIYSIFANTHLGGKAFESYEDKIKTRLGGLLTLGSPILSGGGSAASLADEAAKGASLGAGRTSVKQWLQKAGNLEREQLIKDIEGVGFKKVFDGKGMMHFERGGMKIRLDPPQKNTHFNHMHLELGKKQFQSSYDIFLNRVPYDSPGAHIQIK